MSLQNLHLSRRLRTGRARVKLAAALLAVFAAGLAGGALLHDPVARLFGAPGEEGAPAEPAAAGQLWTCGMHPQVIQDRPGTCPICGMALTPVASSGAATSQASGERKIKYWWDPMMSPPFISNQPGKSPMGMDLVPVYEDEVSAGSALTIDPAVVQNMGLRLATVAEAPLARRIRAVGILKEPEPGRHDVNLRLGGWIDRLHADTEGMRLERGDPLFDLYSPELQVAVEELIGARKLRNAGSLQGPADSIYRSAERKLELYGVSPEQIAELAGLEGAPRAITFLSPAGGYLVEKMVYAGAAVMAGDTVMRIVDTSVLWLDARVFEKDLAHVDLGQEVAATVDGRPGETFRGAVILVHPRIDSMSRTALVRIEIDNPELALRDGMFATAFLEVEIAPLTLVVPREAVIDTGARQVAFVALDQGHFEPRKVALGAQGEEGLVQVLSGLAPGERVVVSGQFLLDAESRMNEAIRRFLEQKSAPPPEAEPAAPIASALKDVSEDWMRFADEALGAYLDLARVLGASQESDELAEVSELVRATEALRALAIGQDQSTLAGALADAAAAMRGRPIAERRKLFKAVSDAAIELAERSPRSGAVAPTVFVAHCPMVAARWLQDGREIANPYYATTMKSCGEIERAVPIPSSGTREHGEHGGGHR